MILPKWHVKNRNVKKSDVAFIQNSNAVHGEWKLGIVSETFPRKDDKIKKVNIHIKISKLRRTLISIKEQNTP